MSDDADYADCCICQESGYKTTVEEYATWSAPERAAITPVFFDETVWKCLECGAFAIFNILPYEEQA